MVFKPGSHYDAGAGIALRVPAWCWNRTNFKSSAQAYHFQQSDCRVLDDTNSIWQGKKEFLGMITTLVILMVSVSYYEPGFTAWRSPARCLLLMVWKLLCCIPLIGRGQILENCTAVANYYMWFSTPLALQLHHDAHRPGHVFQIVFNRTLVCACIWLKIDQNWKWCFI